MLAVTALGLHDHVVLCSGIGAGGGCVPGAANTERSAARRRGVPSVP